MAALVGPNGAGKTALLNLVVGLAAPSVGGVTVLGGRAPGSPAALDGSPTSGNRRDAVSVSRTRCLAS